jgi:disulfide bond formation protein DsbB
VIFLSSLFASAMTLIYSEIFLQIPCALCWFERIFMYGTLLLSGLSLFEPHPTHYHFQLKNILIFSIFGAFISLYHHILQMTAAVGSHLPCPSSGGDCAKRIMFEYGHITFPWAATILFAFFISIILIQNKLRQE